ncbi:MAG: DNA topoisomerase I [Candidatus Methanosuratincola petrocarbonis]
MAHHLLVCEKPSAARKIAYALGGRGVGRIGRGVPFYRFQKGADIITVVSALGHLYSPVQQGKGWSFPVFNLVWKPAAGGRAKRFLEEIARLAKEADSFISACDYDTEGSLIAFMILRNACGGADANARRMKFSSLTRDELLRAYENASELDMPVINAGKARHEIDWIFGVNVSRAIMDAYSCNTGSFEVLSAGRVQSPTLDALCRREDEIDLHVPDPYWAAGAEIRFLSSGEAAEAEYSKNPILRKGEGEALRLRCDRSPGTVRHVEEGELTIPAPHPFDLGELQSEAYRVFGLQPWRTQKVAEGLYLEGLISYPRTSSQQLPPSIGFRGILTKLGTNEAYKESVSGILNYADSGRGLWPRQGKKSDPAHPAIHPTGIKPNRLGADARKVYDLIVKRFISTFGPPARKSLRSIEVELEQGDVFTIEAEAVSDPGWMKHYAPYVKISSSRLPEAKEGEAARAENVWVEERFTDPPPRFNQSSLIKFMERNGLGTKSTRAEIIGTLYRRGYISGSSIHVTELGRGVIEMLRKRFPDLVSIGLTRDLEERMAGIEEGREEYSAVLIRGAEAIKGAFECMISEFEAAGAEVTSLVDGLRDQGKIGACPSCKNGELRVIRSRKTGKRFVGCSNYGAGCSFSAPLPQRGTIKPSGETCRACGYPTMLVIGGWTKPWRVCLNPECPARVRR